MGWNARRIFSGGWSSGGGSSQGPFELFGSIIGSQPFGMIMSMLNARQQRQQQEAAQRQLDRRNQMGEQLVQPISQEQHDFYAQQAQYGMPDSAHRRHYEQLAGQPYGDQLPSLADTTGAAQELSQQGMDLASQYFDPSQRSQQYGRAYGPIMEELMGLPGQAQAGQQQVQDLYGQLGGQLGQGAQQLAGDYSGLAGDYQQQLQRARGLVTQLGGQERSDIQQYYRDLGSQQQANLTARGLGGTTVTSSQAAMTGREERGALGRLQDQIVRQQLGVEQQFGGAALAARERGMGAMERMLGMQTGLGVTQAGAMQQGNQFNINALMESLMQRGNIRGGQMAAYDQSAINRLQSMMSFGGLPIHTGLQAGQTALQHFGPPTTTMPAPYEPTVPQAYGGY